MIATRFATASIFVLFSASAHAVDVPVSYTVNEAALKRAVSGTSLTFELHGDSDCASPATVAVIVIDDLQIVRLKGFKPSGGTKPPKTDELRTTLTGVTAPGHFYLEVTGTGVTPV